MSSVYPESAPAFMPSADVSCETCPDLENVDIGDKVSGNFTYEVVSKDEYCVTIKIKSMTIVPSKRIK